jgi:glycogen operon protein
MGVDGFRFDLATVLGRTDHGFDSHAAFFAALRQDPLLARVHLIAEPWDAGPNGYQVGRFPGRFLDWNDKFRDAVRGYWLRLGVNRGEFARRFTASSDLFRHDQRRPSASINFLSVHDGFTLADVVSYSHKHNEGNGEKNRDGRDEELCTNFGVEGETDDATINAVRQRVRRAMMATLLLAKGTPMLCAGDEISKTQRGNNNAYCQDNVLGWLDWATADNSFEAFVAELVALRAAEPWLHSNDWFSPEFSKRGGPTRTWWTPTGQELQIADWHDTNQLAFACQLVGRPKVDMSEDTPYRLLLAFNPAPTNILFKLDGECWQLVLDSSGESDRTQAVGTELALPARALVLLRGSAC